MRIKPFPVLTGLWLLLTAPVVTLAWPPPASPRPLPGDVKGWLTARWLGPYVSATLQRAGTTQLTTVRWLDADGKVLRELSGPRVDAHPAFVYEIGDGGTTVHAVNGDWKIRLPKKDGPAGYLTGTVDSRTFVHEFHPKEGEIAADVYMSGKLAGTVGPFLQYQSQDVHLGLDGSLALLVWKEAEKKTPQIVVAGSDGKIRFRADCDGPVMSPVVAPDGGGVLVQANTGGDSQNTFTYYTGNGRVSSLNVGPNAHFMAWLPGTATALFHTSIGHDYHFHLIDWNKGRRLCDVADPCPARVLGPAPTVAVVKDYLLIGGLEYVAWGDGKEPVRSIYALDARTDHLVARWMPKPLNQPARDPGRFLRLGNKLFLVTDEEFAELALADIAAKKNGWE
jgi:hypothetical protein